MKVFISQPMRGLSNEEILILREKVQNYIREQYKEEDIEFIDSFFKDAPVDAKPLWYLADSLKLMSEADIIVFAGAWSTARGCIIEHKCAKDYGYDIVYVSNNLLDGINMT